MTSTPGPLPGLQIIQPQAFGDARGYFMEAFSTERYTALGLPEVWVQDNESLSRRGTWRGLHLQAPPYAQGKLVRVARGAALDVVVDIRLSSATYGQSFAIELTAGNKTQLWVPEGFAHGFLTLEDDTLFLYKVSGSGYNKESEMGLHFADPELNIYLPFEPTVVSEKDAVLPYLADFRSPFA